jgi:N-acetyltransferase
VDSAITNDQSTNQLFPIFYKDQQKTSDATQNVAPSIFNNLKQNRKRKYRPIMTGGDQYQIDAGQKAFGGIECSVCGLFYTQHEPEEELLHEQYHNSVKMLNFKVSGDVN